MSRKYDIRRQVQEIDTTLGGVTVTSTAIETRDLELQTLNGRDVLALGGLRLEAQYKAFCHKDANIQEEDTLSPDSGTTKYQVVYVHNLFNEHLEAFVKKIE